MPIIAFYDIWGTVVTIKTFAIDYILQSITVDDNMEFNSSFSIP